MPLIEHTKFPVAAIPIIYQLMYCLLWPRNGLAVYRTGRIEIGN